MTLGLDEWTREALQYLAIGWLIYMEAKRHRKHIEVIKRNNKPR